ncbi:hypothetical protein ADK67_14745 [Saccharothrix sp. NRRL B-16348]|nr:hypothetical protein ADK67_14745 [Saccharothrix sp. NRRL B-16348]
MPASTTPGHRRAAVHRHGRRTGWHAAPPRRAARPTGRCPAAARLARRCPGPAPARTPAPSPQPDARQHHPWRAPESRRAR